MRLKCSIFVTECLDFYAKMALKPMIWSRSRRLSLETVSIRTNVCSRSRLCLGYLRLVPKTLFCPNFASHTKKMQWNNRTKSGERDDHRSPPASNQFSFISHPINGHPESRVYRISKHASLNKRD